MDVTYGDDKSRGEMSDEDIDLEEDVPASDELIAMLGFDPDEDPDEDADDEDDDEGGDDEEDETEDERTNDCVSCSCGDCVQHYEEVVVSKS